MKKFLATLLAVLCVAAVCALTGCNGNKPTDNAKSGNVVVNVQSVVFTADGEFTALTETTSLKDYMDKLKENGELVFDGNYGDYGFYLQSVYSTVANDNAFWAVYTDLVTLEGDDTVYSNADYGTYEYGGKTLYSAVYGVSGIPCVNGYTYALVYTAF